ncbi:hypothetical protein C5167_050055 [Papaver somniferum]|uniref:Uncharacterized protein n=1 Tax=Papaver somniferum TaxID=3469 RepID=A0A4Y7KR35_PAPSO|nr:hypothetical protein C5167_050055 [Papaver somniferum]
MSDLEQIGDTTANSLHAEVATPMLILKLNEEDAAASASDGMEEEWIRIFIRAEKATIHLRTCKKASH